MKPVGDGVSMQHDVLTEPSGDGAVSVNGPATGADGIHLPPLAVSALMVTKADLLVALRVYLPQLTDIEAISGDRFLLHLGPHPEHRA
jgi:hypothetical protein